MGADPDWEPKAHFSLRVFSGWWWGLSPTRMGWKHEALSVLLPTLPIGGRAKGVSSSMGLGGQPPQRGGSQLPLACSQGSGLHSCPPQNRLSHPAARGSGLGRGLRKATVQITPGPVPGSCQCPAQGGGKTVLREA